MSSYSERRNRQQKRFRDMRGEWVTFSGKQYKCFVEEVSGAKAGEQAVSRAYGTRIASTVPAIFDFSPLDFAPNTSDAPPQEGDVIIRNGFNYEVEASDYENEDTDTTGFFVYCLRQLWSAPATP